MRKYQSMSSLQRAAANPLHPPAKPPSRTRGPGAFESSFAHGLDLTEFASSASTAAGPKECASAELLRRRNAELSLLSSSKDVCPLQSSILSKMESTSGPLTRGSTPSDPLADVVCRMHAAQDGDGSLIQSRRLLAGKKRRNVPAAGGGKVRRGAYAKFTKGKQSCSQGSKGIAVAKKKKKTKFKKTH